MAHLQAPLPQLPAADDFSRAINLILTRALAKDAAERYPSARAMKSDLVSAAALAPSALELPDVTAIRHVIVPGVVAGAPIGGGTGADGSSADQPGRSPRRPLVAVLAAVIAVLLAVVGTYAVVAASAGERSVELSDVAGDASPPLTASVPSESGEPTATDESSDEPSGDTSGKGENGTKGSTGKKGSKNGGGVGPRLRLRRRRRHGPRRADRPRLDRPRLDRRRWFEHGWRHEGRQRRRGPRAGWRQRQRNPADQAPEAEPRSDPDPGAPAPEDLRVLERRRDLRVRRVPGTQRPGGAGVGLPNNYSCASDPTAGGPRLVILTCQRKTQYGRGEIRYTLWTSVAAATDYFAGQNGSKADPWKSDWGYTWFRETPKNELKYQRTNVYAEEPVSVVVRGVNLQAHQQIVGTVKYRQPANLRGAPL